LARFHSSNARFSKKMSTSARRPIARRRLLKRVRIVGPRLLWLVAPAGFGKTTLATTLARKSPESAICACRGVGDVTEFARRVIAALTESSNEQRAFPFQQRLPFTHDDADLPTAAVQAWRQTLGATTFIFDDATDIAGDPAMLSLFTQLLARPHPTRRVIVASRTRLDVPAAGFAPPNEVLSFDANDLRFDTEEISRIFGSGLEDAHGIEAATAGWPIAVLVLANAASEGNVASALADIRAGRRRDVATYFTQEIVERLDAPHRDALILTTFVPNGSVPQTILRERCATVPLADTPFVTVTPKGSSSVHPFAQSILTAAYRSRAEVVIGELIDVLRSRGDDLAVARLALAINDVDTSADALAGIAPFLQGALPPEAANVLSAFTFGVLECRPPLWSAATLARMPSMDAAQWLDECRRLYAAISNETSVQLRLAITSPYAYAAGLLGCFEEGRAALAALLSAVADAPPTERRTAQAHATMWFAAYDVWRGDPVDLTRLTRTVDPLLADDALRALWASDVVAARHRMDGNGADERAALHEACEAAGRTGLAAPLIAAQSDAAFGVWASGDDEAFERRLAPLEQPPIARFPAAAFFVDCARGRTQSGVSDSRPPKVRCQAYLMAAAATRDRKRAAGFAMSARQAADQARSAYYQVIARVALAAIDQTSGSTLLDEAVHIARDHRNATLEAALEALRAGTGDATVLGGVSRRFRYFQDAASARLLFSPASLRVREGDHAVAVSERETAVLTRIAFSSEPLSAMALGAEFWPKNRAPASAAKGCVRRLRSKLGNAAVCDTPAGYVLGSDVCVDLFEAEQTLGHIDDGRQLQPELRHNVERYRASLRPQFPAFAQRWAWIRPYEQRIRRAYGAALEVLAGDALLRDDLVAALERTTELLAVDPCNERGCELAMTAARRQGDLGAAVAEFRRFEAALHRRFDREPPERLRVLLRATIRSERATLRAV